MIIEGKSGSPETSLIINACHSNTFNKIQGGEDFFSTQKVTLSEETKIYIFPYFCLT